MSGFCNVFGVFVAAQRTFIQSLALCGTRRFFYNLRNKFMLQLCDFFCCDLSAIARTVFASCVMTGCFNVYRPFSETMSQSINEICLITFSANGTRMDCISLLSTSRLYDPILIYMFATLVRPNRIQLHIACHNQLIRIIFPTDELIPVLLRIFRQYNFLVVVRQI